MLIHISFLSCSFLKILGTLLQSVSNFWPYKHRETLVLFLWFNLGLELSLYKLLIWFETVWDQHSPATPEFQCWQAARVTLNPGVGGACEEFMLSARRPWPPPADLGGQAAVCDPTQRLFHMGFIFLLDGQAGGPRGFSF